MPKFTFARIAPDSRFPDETYWNLIVDFSKGPQIETLLAVQKRLYPALPIRNNIPSTSIYNRPRVMQESICINRNGGWFNAKIEDAVEIRESDILEWPAQQ